MNLDRRSIESCKHSDAVSVVVVGAWKLLASNIAIFLLENRTL